MSAPPTMLGRGPEQPPIEPKRMTDEEIDGIARVIEHRLAWASNNSMTADLPGTVRKLVAHALATKDGNHENMPCVVVVRRRKRRCLAHGDNCPKLA